jgi:adenosine deaminase
MTRSRTALHLALRLAVIWGLLFPALAYSAPPQAGSEADATALFDRLAGEPARLRIFLQAMPKGADLHNHLWGQPYAEEFLGWAAGTGKCISRADHAIVAPPCADPDRPPAKGLGERDPKLYTAMIEAFSTRGHVRGMGVNDVSRHDDFFDSFGRFAAFASASGGKMLASARLSAAANNVAYLELIQNPNAIDAMGKIAAGLPWSPDDFSSDLDRISGRLPGLIGTAISEIDAMEKEAAHRLGCDRAPKSAPCLVKTRYLPYALRALPPPFVFGQMALAFALAEKDPRIAGVNIVAPEDGPVALANYGLHMRMFRFFATRHPNVKLALHAGELTLGLVPPADLRFHIRDAIDIAGAKRIGHGVDIAYETNAPDLLARMARDRIAVEINLTSNANILGVSGKQHPLSLYRAAAVPVVLSTDDEGVSRSDMTNEYQRAVTEQGLNYVQLKAIARASMEYSFLPGASLWQSSAPTMRVNACSNIKPVPSGTCSAFLAKNEKARMQWQLEQAFDTFEQSIVAAKF